jgi:hypothetical protein
VEELFGFRYTWEVYKPAAEREYGYYVLPVLYGDRFVARCEPTFDGETGVLRIEDWWWEAGFEPDATMVGALAAALRDFIHYLGADSIRLGDEMAEEPVLEEAVTALNAREKIAERGIRR